MSTWNTDLIVALQSGGDALIDFFTAFTFLGNQEFYLLLLPLFFWCLDRATGARLTVIYLLSAVLNTDLKELIRAPRPLDVDPGLLAVADPDAIKAVGYGMPSGHAQLAITVWGGIAAWVKRGWFWAIALVLAFLIGLSRVALGAHYPTQVGAGWLIGLVVLLAYLALTLPVERWLGGLAFGAQMVVAVAAPAVLLVIHIEPDTIAATAVLMGLGVGLAVAGRVLPAEQGGSLWQRAARYLVGVVILLAIYFGLSALLPAEGEPLHVLLRFARYVLLGLWMSLGAPWLFHLLRLQPAGDAPLATAD